MAKNISAANSHDKAPRAKGYSLYVRILTAFIALISITVLPIVIYGYFVDSYIMLTMADNLISQVTKTAIDKSIDYLMPLSRIVEISSNMAEIDVISPTDNARLERYTLQILKSYPHTSMFYLGDENGNFLMARRLEDGTIATNIVNRKTSPPQRNLEISQRGLQGREDRAVIKREVRPPPPPLVWRSQTVSSRSIGPMCMFFTMAARRA